MGVREFLSEVAEARGSSENGPKCSSSEVLPLAGVDNHPNADFSFTNNLMRRKLR